jgi:hypothetical protein
MHSLRSGLQLEERPGRTGASINHHTEGNQMPRNKPGSKVVDNGNEESGRKSRGPALNRVFLVGRLASDPELHYTPSGSAVAQLRLATNEGEEPQFHSLSAWSHSTTAEGCTNPTSWSGRWSHRRWPRASAEAANAGAVAGPGDRDDAARVRGRWRPPPRESGSLL